MDKAGDALQPKIDAMETACESINFWDESSRTRVRLPLPKSVRNDEDGEDDFDLDQIEIPSLDLGELDGANTQLFADFCYNQPECKNAYQDVVRTAVREIGRCAEKLGDEADDLFQLEDVEGLIDDLCPILTHRFITRFTLNGEMEDYDTDEAKAKIIAAVAAASGLAIAPLATINLRPGSVVAEVSIPVSNEAQAKAAQTQLQTNGDLNSALADAGLTGATVESGSLDVQVEEQNSGLSAGAIVGIVVGSVVLVLLLLAVLAYCLLRSKRKNEHKKAEPTHPPPAVVTGQPVENPKMGQAVV
jgi:tetrahydromethanopterin S-methyltransferase subunit F